MISSNFLQKCVLFLHVPPFTRNTYILTLFPTSLEKFFRTIRRAISGALVLILPKIKFNSQLPHCAFFFLFQLAALATNEREPKQTSIFHLNSMGNQSLGTSRGLLHLSASPGSPDKFGWVSPSYWISYIVWSSCVVFESVWHIPAPLPHRPQLKGTGGKTWLKDTRNNTHSIETYWVRR